MKDETPSKRRIVSKARLLKELLATIDTHGLNPEDQLQKLIQAIRDDIVTEQMNK